MSPSATVIDRPSFESGIATSVETPILRLGTWTLFKHRLPYRLRPLCAMVERHAFARRGLRVWVDHTLIRMAIDAAPTPSTSAGHIEEYALMAHVLRSVMPGDLFLDVGSHIGLYALAAAARVGDAGRVIAFEPTPMTVEKLVHNVELNDATRRIQIERIALSDADGSVEFLTTGSSMMNSIFTGAPPDQHRPPVPERRITVRTGRLDSFFDATRRTVAKIDTEGHEIAVLRGAPRLLNSDARIFVELHPWAWGGGVGDWSELQALCSRAGRILRLLDGTVLDHPAHRRVELVHV
jgi:FkbM family methyltransferase